MVGMQEDFQRALKKEPKERPWVNDPESLVSELIAQSNTGSVGCPSCAA